MVVILVYGFYVAEGRAVAVNLAAVVLVEHVANTVVVPRVGEVADFVGQPQSYGVFDGLSYFAATGAAGGARELRVKEVKEFNDLNEVKKFKAESMKGQVGHNGR